MKTIKIISFREIFLLVRQRWSLLLLITERLNDWVYGLKWLSALLFIFFLGNWIALGPVAFLYIALLIFLVCLYQNKRYLWFICIPLILICILFYSVNAAIYFEEILDFLTHIGCSKEYVLSVEIFLSKMNINSSSNPKTWPF